LREKKKFEIKFITESTLSSDTNTPLPAILGATNSTRMGKRFKSATETYTRTNKIIGTTNQANVSMYRNNDELNLAPCRKRKKNYGCYLCRQSECSQWSCNKLQQYNGTILKKNSDVVRQKFGASLINPYDGIIELRKDDDKRVVLNSFPKKGVRAIVIHKRMQIKENMLQTQQIDNLAIETTLLKIGGEPIEDYKEVLFAPFCVYKWVTDSKNSLVVHQI